MYKILKITLLGFHKIFIRIKSRNYSNRISQPCYLSYNVLIVSGINSGKKELNCQI